MRSTRSRAASVRAADPTDADRLVALLSEPLRVLYPGSDVWLARKLDDLSAGRAQGLVAAAADGAIAGTVLTTVKHPSTVKINTLYVAPAHRNEGIGRDLLTAALADFDRRHIDEAYVTVAHHLADELEAVLHPNGFTFLTQVPHRYGPGRHERVYTWLRDPTATSSARQPANPGTASTHR